MMNPKNLWNPIFLKKKSHSACSGPNLPKVGFFGLFSKSPRGIFLILLQEGQSILKVIMPGKILFSQTQKEA